MDNTNPLPSFLTSVVVVDLKAPCWLQAITDRIKSRLQGGESESLLEGFNQTEFDKLMTLLEGNDGNEVRY